MIQVAVIGGAGYTGLELVRLLAGHPQAALAAVTSRANAGELVADVFPSLRGSVDLAFSSPDDAALQNCDVAFFATPNGTAMNYVPGLLEAGVRVVDLAADFRLKDPELWSQWYGVPHACPELLDDAVYGLPEVARDEISQARLVANPGCYPTAVQLGLIPLLEAGVISTDGLIADAKSGVSGAGRKEAVATLLCEASENMKAYSVAGHRHLPEIRQGLQRCASSPVDLTFVPHLTPMIRGIHATLYARLLQPESTDVQELFQARYQDEPFVDVMPAGSHPETRSVRGTNGCRVSWHRPQGGDTLVVLSVIDNLVKGAAGQAIQNMNLMFGFAETAGLEQLAAIP
ncbi:MAG: N-acetyl-gamma-glutamyl-phosphate reductase [Gammaproteobacteria bacterium]|nr:MAG: N-acetyl-gamma-glutamyl-phosphate reductase [Gammaproteobacteria bacterium]